MTRDEVRQAVVDALKRVAPEIDPSTIDPHLAFRDQLDLDSMDVLNFALAVHERLGVDIPESDYPHLATLEGAVTYLSAKIAAGGAAGNPAGGA
jgi:acyl carrier protein